MLQRVDDLDDRIGLHGGDDRFALHKEQAGEVTTLDGVHGHRDDLRQCAVDAARREQNAGCF